MATNDLIAACEANIRTLEHIARLVRQYYRGEKTAEQAFNKILVLTDMTDQTRAAICDAQVERVMAMSDEEVLAECRAEGRDPEQIAIEMRAIFERAVEIANARRDAEKERKS